MNGEYKILLSNSSFEILKVNNLCHKFPMHIHKRACIGRIDSGSKILFINGKTILLNQGDLFIIPAFEPHLCYTKNGTPVSYTVICFDADINELNANIINILSKFIKTEKTDFFIENLCGIIKKNNKPRNQKVDKLLTFIDENYMENLTVKLLAEITYFSPFHLLHLFKQEIRISLHQYILQTRIKKFIEKAAFSKNNILDIGLYCGFYDQSHLIRNFKKYVGATPQKYINSVELISKIESF
ncbi:MAG TPA: AraC family transcriptional regulator [bacterium]|nr:AraC family transcriptional regulator [bacterium]